jgi:hypothetical protein
MHAALLGQQDSSICWERGATRQVWIGSSNYGPHTARFVPPHHARVPAAIADLTIFMQRNDLAVLPQAAIAHAQFETIHPFPDGNGRTGRAIVHCLLRGKRLTRRVTVPVSAGLLTDTDRYFDALMAYRSGDTSPIVERFAAASFDSVVNGRQLVGELRAIRAAWSDTITSRRQAIVWRVLDVVLQHPVLDNCTDPARVGRVGDGSRGRADRTRRHRSAAGDHRRSSQPAIRRDRGALRTRRLRRTCRATNDPDPSRAFLADR